MVHPAGTPLSRKDVTGSGRTDRPAPSRPRTRSTSWWLEQLRRRRERMADEYLDLSTPVAWSGEAEQRAAVAFFNAAFRAEESGLRQAHELAAEVAAADPDLAECLRLYGDEEGWHRELLTEFLAHIGGEIRPMGKVTRTFYRLYGRAERMETIVLVNLMFETIGSTTYRMALRRVKHPTVRQMLTILTRDESFHVPLNVHFLRHAVAGKGPAEKAWLRLWYKLTFVALVASAYASRRRAKDFDTITFPELARAYAEHLGALFAQETDLGFRPPSLVLRALGIDPTTLVGSEAARVVGLEAAEAAVDRERTAVTAL